jgi:hypothetical protein
LNNLRWKLKEKFRIAATVSDDMVILMLPGKDGLNYFDELNRHVENNLKLLKQATKHIFAERTLYPTFLVYKML